jgi:hypothetical protein
MDTDFLTSLLVEPLKMSRHYEPMKLPTLLMMNTNGQGDLWVRDQIRGTHEATPPTLTMVVVSDSHEADRIFSLYATLKARQGIVIGGAASVRYDGPETIAREKARYAR